MIQKVRVDFRLIHGQIIHSWLKSISANTICIVHDELKLNPIKIQLLKAFTPASVRLYIYEFKEGINYLESIKEHKKEKVLVLTEDIITAIKLCEILNIHTLNIGETLYSDKKKKLANCVYVSLIELEVLNDYVSKGNRIEIQQVPDSKKTIYKEVTL